MNFKRFFNLKTVLVFYVAACVVLIFQSGLFSGGRESHADGVMTLASEVNIPAEVPSAVEPSTESMRQLAEGELPLFDITAVNHPKKTILLGSVVPAAKGNDFLLEVGLTSKGAAITTARTRDYTDLASQNPQPLSVISPLDGRFFSMANQRMTFPDYGKAFPLDKLNWDFLGQESLGDGTQKAVFEAILKDGLRDALKVTKSYSLSPNSYMVVCDIAVSNVSGEMLRASMDMLGPVGIERQGSRGDMRTVTGAFLTPAGQVATTKLKISKLQKDYVGPAELLHKDPANKFMWGSIANKYFVSIVRPVPKDSNSLVPGWLSRKMAYFYSYEKLPGLSEDNIGLGLRTGTTTILPGAAASFSFQVYIGPKDKDLFESVPLFSRLGFINAVDFQACCGDVFRPLSFLILDMMKWMHDFFWPHNYGIVIIIFVVIVRILLHPITKKSQVSMMKMSKLGPMAEEIKKKYANNKAEQNKQMMALYKEHGASPVLGCLPMLLQMPIWIALYSAIYVSIELRGAAFLPFWITDLSAPDALFAFPAAVENIPVIGTFLGSSFNLLPVLLGVSMFAQQRLMPSSSAASSNPQAAQQQKMMMWMMPVMMLLFLYRAPSGLNLYIMASTSAGVVEQYVIRKHIREREEAERSGLVPVTSKTGGKLKKKKPKPPIKFS